MWRQTNYKKSHREVLVLHLIVTIPYFIFHVCARARRKYNQNAVTFQFFKKLCYGRQREKSSSHYKCNLHWNLMQILIEVESLSSNLQLTRKTKEADNDKE